MADHLNRRITRLEEKVSHLERLNAPGQKDEASDHPQEDSGQEGQTAPGQKIVSDASNIPPAPRNTQKAKQPWYKTAQGWKVALEIVAIPFAVGYAIVTYFQWHDVRSNFKISQRAFVYAQDPILIGDGGMPGVRSDRPAFLIVDLMNSGDTPARNGTSDINFCAVEQKIIPGNFAFPKNEDKKAKLLIGPKSGGHVGIELPLDTLADIEAGRKTMIVYGGISYQDIFDKWHRTEFCYDYRGFMLNKEGTGIEKLIWSDFNRHNCNDEDCPENYGDVGCPKPGEKYAPVKPRQPATPHR
jgi:hypothetical protein